MHTHIRMLGVSASVCFAWILSGCVVVTSNKAPSYTEKLDRVLVVSELPKMRNFLQFRDKDIAAFNETFANSFQAALGMHDVNARLTSMTGIELDGEDMKGMVNDLKPSTVLQITPVKVLYYTNGYGVRLPNRIYVDANLRDLRTRQVVWKGHANFSLMLTQDSAKTLASELVGRLREDGLLKN